jgi:diaminopimelate epimerase
MRTIERGVGETMSCGSGTCAVAGYCIKNNLTDKVMKVTSRGSDIMDTSAEISWDGEGKPMLLGGNYSFVFTGEIEI